MVHDAPILAREARDLTTAALFGLRTTETGGSDERLCAVPGGSQSTVSCPTHLGRPAIALAAEASTHHGHFHCRLRRKSDSTFDFWCE